MSRWAMLLLVVASAAAAGMAAWSFADRAPVREAVAATQWAVVMWFAGAFLVAAVVVGILAAATSRVVRWRYKVFNPFAILASCAVPVAAIVWVGHTLLASVPAAKLELLVGDLTNREPKLLSNARPFSDQMSLGNVSEDMVTKDIGFLRGLDNAGTDFRVDGKVIIDGALAPYEYPPLADPAAERLDWGTVTARLVMKDGGEYRRPLVIIGNRSNYDDRKRVHESLKEKRQQLRDLSATHGAHQFLKSAADRFDDLVSRILIEEPMPEAIDALSEWTRKLAARTKGDVVKQRRSDHEEVWKGYLTAIAPAIDAIQQPHHAGPVTEALRTGKKLLGEHANWSKSADPAWWVVWKQQVEDYPGMMPTPPIKSLDKLGVQGRGQRDDVERELVAFKAYIDEVLRSPIEAQVPPPPTTTPGMVPGSWTPAGVEAIIKERLGLQRWSGQTYPNGQEVLAVIQSEWGALWQRINPQNTPKLDDAVRAAQAIEMSKIKLFLRRYGEDLRKRIQDTKSENYQRAGRFREPFRTTPPFSDDNYRKRLREEWLVELVGISPATIDSVPQPPNFVGQVECTKDACSLAEKAVECFDRVCGEASKPADADWRHAGLWYLIFFGGPGDKPGFNPFEEASGARQPTTVKGADGKDLSIGGLSSTDEATLNSYGQPKPAATTPTPPKEDVPQGLRILLRSDDC